MFITNARWLEPDGHQVSGVIEVENGLIHLHPGCPSPPGDSDILFNARSHIILPGLIDCHVHFREPGLVKKEGIANGSKAALIGGVTTVLEMPNTVPPCSTPARFEAKKALYQKKCLTNWGLHFEGTSTTQSVPSDAASLKIYMAKSSANKAVSTEDGLAKLLSLYKRVSVHAEDESCFVPPAARKRLFHHELRPVESITSALTKLEAALRSLDKGQRPRLVLCHVGTRVEVDWLVRMKNDGFDVWGETCPHYCFFTQDKLVQNGPLFKVNPPLRTAEDRDAVVEALSDGTIDFLSTDHAPHLPEEKDGPLPPSGIASIECLGSLAMLLVDQGKLSMTRMLEVCVQNPARCYGIEGRDAIREGNAADLIVLSTSSGKAEPESVVTHAERHPYTDFPFTRYITATLVGGVIKQYEGRLLSSIPGKEVVS